MKRCSGCHELKPDSEFHKNRARRDGLQGYCKPCRALIDHADYERTRGGPAPARIWERGRAAWLVSLKAGRPCTDCRQVFPPAVMQWDHLPGTEKLGNISTGLRWRSRPEILEEIAKCELVCANCHAIRTFERSGWAATWSIREESGSYWLEPAVA